MGCSASSAAPRPACGAPALGGAAEAIHVFITRIGETPIGFTIQALKDDILITSIQHDGLLKEWNSLNPSCEVRPGDVVTAVNGVRGGTFWDRATKMWAAQTLDLEVIRAGTNHQMRRTKTREVLEEHFPRPFKKQFPPLSGLTQRVATQCCATECAICCEDFAPDAKVVQLGCNHGFHPDCLGQWMVRGRDTCPMCRRPASKDEEDPQPTLYSL